MNTEPKFSAADTASYVRFLSELRPEILSGNVDIQVSQSVLYPLSAEQIGTGNECADRR